jgi:protein O-GlcNAc transferase
VIDPQLNRIEALWRGGRPADAELALREWLTESPQHPSALRFLAEVCAGTGRQAEAVELWRQLSRLTPTDTGVLRHLANSLLACQRPAEAIEVLRLAITHEPDNARGHNSLGLALLNLGEIAAARQSLEAAVALDPGNAIAFFNLGLAAQLAGDKAAAIDCYRRAIALDRLLARARLRLSTLLAEYDPREARREHDRALESQATNLVIEHRYDEALPLYSQLIDRGAELPYLVGSRFFCQLCCCDWSEYDATVARLESEVMLGRPAGLPFALLAHSASPAAQLQAARTFSALVHEVYGIPGDTAGTPYPNVRPGVSRRIRVVYLSADLHDHATAHLIAGLLESHDRSRFEVTTLSFGPSSPDRVRQRIESAVERFVDVRHKSDDEVASLITELGTDIAIDLKGHTQGARLQIFARHPAPLQVNFLGFPGSLGVDYIQYIVADRHVIPAADQAHYSEKVIYLPECYQSNDALRVRPLSMPARADLGLPERGMVFCCFNQAFKITPAVFGVWMSILRATSGSVIWLYERNKRATANLRAAAERLGVAPQRLVFAPHVELSQHLARYRCADVFLDTVPCNAHTTASDALWMGVPVLTVTGTTFAGRVATSLLHAVGLPELALDSLQEYERTAIQLANRPDEVTALKRRLEENRAHCPLFDTTRYTRYFERALTEMWRRHVTGAPVAGFSVSPDDPS